jgi:hypothetical protein
MREVRLAVNASYNWDQDRVDLVQKLLYQDNFIAPDLEDVRII